MRYFYFMILFISCTLQMFAQDEDCYDETFSIRTIDPLVWNDSLCFISESPICRLEGYETLFSSVADDYREVQFFPTLEDKRYCLLWIIADSTLYLSGVDAFPYLTAENALQQWRRENRDRDTLEAFTYCKFVKKQLPLQSPFAEVAAKGVMEATWFTGSLYIMPKEIYWSKEKNKHFYFMTFEKGKLVKQETIIIPKKK